MMLWDASDLDLLNNIQGDYDSWRQVSILGKVNMTRRADKYPKENKAVGDVNKVI